MMCNMAQPLQGPCNGPTLPPFGAVFFLFVDWDFLYFCEVVAHKSGIVTATPEGVRT